MSKENNVFLTGKPGIGKTTVIKKVIKEMKDKGIKICGFVAPEVRERNKRTAFKLISLYDGEEAVLASVNQDKGPKVSKYRVNLDNLKHFSQKIILNFDESDLIVIDEIGKMEMYSDTFKKAIEKAIDSEKPFLATLHGAYIGEFSDKAEIIEVSKKNRDMLPVKLVEEIEKNGTVQLSTSFGVFQPRP